MNAHYTVADYLLDRLAQIGIRHLFGVPGDYNLHFLDHVIDHPQIRWVGCANELNAAYAADGYARCQPAAALLTTFGVGELSAVNGIAGSYAEYLPVIHLVGAPMLRAQRAGEMLHHTLGDGDFGHFARMAQEVTAAQASLTLDNAKAEIDRLLSVALTERRPVYLLLPGDVAQAPLTPPLSPLRLPAFHSAPEALAGFIAAACELLQPARHVTLVADFLAERFGARQALAQWMDEVPLPHATLLMGKSVLDETHTGFIGTYSGAASDPLVRQRVEEADATILVGVRLTDTITAGFSQRLTAEKCIDIQPFAACVGRQTFSPLAMHDAVQALHQLTMSLNGQWPPLAVSRPELPAAEGDKLDQHALWRQLQAFLQPGDAIIADQGTACFGAAALSLPQGCLFINQPLWGSIGYTLPAAFGVQTAQPDRRVVLLIGDGAAQLTIQELGSLLRDDLKPVILLLNNGGYTVERAIHGPQQRYNDIAAWDWCALPQALGSATASTVRRVSTPQQLQSALQTAGNSGRLALIEVLLPPMDVPELLNSISQAIQLRNDAA
ncbi:alpha-keto acid decarboxylase family protein [Serratia rhizosphaerae]|uniref:Indolepyruvate decarboxylase n=1 Tax=Serratia rhizosphaerae TaxID=2597702 RepID=A0ABX6GQP0_9GAMM|nr:thiamine pyrophosphate-binding protein [Serratia rhizosphaerae]QHA88598.1 indolepyruvate decarboxylase [Serratia rhizosphaerae]